MSSFEGKPHASPASLRFGIFLTLAVVLAIGIGIFLHLNRARNRALQQQMTALRQRMEEVAGKAESAHLRSGG